MTEVDYTSTNPSIALIKKRHEISFNIDYISDVGFLLSYISTLEKRVKILEEEKKEMVKLTKEDMKKLGWTRT